MVRYACTVCGDQYIEQIERGEHWFSDEIIVKFPTCTEKGEATQICSVCGALRTRELEKAEHSFRQSQGMLVCKECGEEQNAETSAEGSDIEKANPVAFGAGDIILTAALIALAAVSAIGVVAVLVLFIRSRAK